MKAAVQTKKSAFSKLEDSLESPFFRRFMSVAYGLGASIVIIGALFKITHINYANQALFLGMITEAIIFALSALQKPHVEPDWSKVHPELLDDYHGGEDEEEIALAKSGGASNQLDQMLQNANIDEELIKRLGAGLSNLGDAATKMNNMSKASIASDDFVANLKTATQSVASLSGSYSKTATAMEQELVVSNEFSTNVKAASQAASQLRQVYTDTTKSLKDDIEASQNLSKNIKSASESASKLAESYFRSSESIVKNIEELKRSTDKNTEFNLQLNKLSDNLSSLNALYELQLKSSEQQSRSSAKLQETMGRFLSDMEKSANQTVQYQSQMDNLTKKMASLNNVYGNMLSAMNVK